MITPSKYVTLNRMTKIELIHACQDIEKRGYECIKAIHPVYRSGKEYSDDRQFRGNYQLQMWRAVYERRAK